MVGSGAPGQVPERGGQGTVGARPGAVLRALSLPSLSLVPNPFTSRGSDVV